MQPKPLGEAAPKASALELVGTQATERAMTRNMQQIRNKHKLCKNDKSMNIFEKTMKKRFIKMQQHKCPAWQRKCSTDARR